MWPLLLTFPSSIIFGGLILFDIFKWARFLSFFFYGSAGFLLVLFQQLCSKHCDLSPTDPWLSPHASPLRCRTNGVVMKYRITSQGKSGQGHHNYWTWFRKKSVRLEYIHHLSSPGPHHNGACCAFGTQKVTASFTWLSMCGWLMASHSP